ncbi:MAG: hypothetical protein ABIA04_05995 [Pseudomonadota bacterium]
MFNFKLLYEKWMWNWEIMRLWLIIPFFLGLLLTIALYPFLGLNSLYFLFTFFGGLQVVIIYYIFGKKVEALKLRVTNKEANILESQILIGKIQTPGIIVLNENSLRLIPLWRDELLINKENLKSYKKSKWLGSKYLPFKECFVCQLSDGRYVSFGLGESSEKIVDRVFVGWREENN